MAMSVTQFGFMPINATSVGITPGVTHLGEPPQNMPSLVVSAGTIASEHADAVMLGIISSDASSRNFPYAAMATGGTPAILRDRPKAQGLMAAPSDGEDWAYDARCVVKGYAEVISALEESAMKVSREHSFPDLYSFEVLAHAALDAPDVALPILKRIAESGKSAAYYGALYLVALANGLIVKEEVFGETRQCDAMSSKKNPDRQLKAAQEILRGLDVAPFLKSAEVDVSGFFYAILISMSEYNEAARIELIARAGSVKRLVDLLLDRVAAYASPAAIDIITSVLDRDDKGLARDLAKFMMEQFYAEKYPGSIEMRQSRGMPLTNNAVEAFVRILKTASIRVKRTIISNFFADDLRFPRTSREHDGYDTYYKFFGMAADAAAHELVATLANIAQSYDQDSIQFAEAIVALDYLRQVKGLKIAEDAMCAIDVQPFAREMLDHDNLTGRDNFPEWKRKRVRRIDEAFYRLYFAGNHTYFACKPPRLVVDCGLISVRMNNKERFGREDITDLEEPKDLGGAIRMVRRVLAASFPGENDGGN